MVLMEAFVLVALLALLGVVLAFVSIRNAGR
jgi:hypothetical protein